MINKKLFVLMAVLLFTLSAKVYADNPNDTPWNTTITADGSSCTLKYTDNSNSQKTNLFTATIETLVAPMYGFDYIENLTDWNYLAPADAIAYTHRLTIEGNANDQSVNFRLNVTATGAAGFDGTGWMMMVTYEGSGGWLGPLYGPYSPQYSGTLPNTVFDEDSSMSFTVRVFPSSDPAQSPDGASLVVTLEVYYNGVTPAGTYYGANWLKYGGTFESSDMFVTCIKTSVMQLTRIATVDAPKTASGKFTGDAHAAVPGAVITYTMIVSNDGSGNATNVTIIDKVPAKTLAAHVGATGTATIPNVNITAAAPNAVGWNSYYSTQASPSLTYGDITGWTTIAALPKSLTVEAGSGATSNVTYVRFDKLTVLPTEDAKTLTWGVTIR
jgi:uncharacterized repeat protein (TIGR01451 family)